MLSCWQKQSKEVDEVSDQKYCKLGNFHKNFIFVDSIKRHICAVRNSRLVQDIRISVNKRVILPFTRVLISRKLRRK